MHVLTVTSRIVSVPCAASVLPLRSNFTSPPLGRILATSNAAGAWPAVSLVASAKNESRPSERYTRTTVHLWFLIVSMRTAFLGDSLFYASPTAFVPHRH